jgi:hypothetical protein
MSLENTTNRREMPPPFRLQISKFINHDQWTTGRVRQQPLLGSFKGGVIEGQQAVRLASRERPPVS